ncbi:MAG: hypothetical protein R2784_18080 [Saprospiraceae bacterium]
MVQVTTATVPTTNITQQVSGWNTITLDGLSAGWYTLLINDDNNWQALLETLPSLKTNSNRRNLERTKRLQRNQWFDLFDYLEVEHRTL